MTDAVSPRPPPGAAGPAAPALGFLLGSFIALIAGCGLLWGQPDRWWAGDGGTAVLTLGYLLAVGWLGSLLFGAAYLLLPVLTGSRWWSPRLAWVHLALHVGGGGWLWIDPGAVWAGGVLFLGALLFVINQQVTANRLSRWDPANLAFTVAMYWLVVAGALAVAPGLAAVSPIGVAADESLMRALAFAGLVGALALAVVGVALKWLPMFLVGTARPAGLSWLGLLLINVGLLAWLAGESGGLVAWRLPAWYALLSGFGALAIDVARLLWSGRRRWDRRRGAVGRGRRALHRAAGGGALPARAGATGWPRRRPPGCRLGSCCSRSAPSRSPASGWGCASCPSWSGTCVWLATKSGRPRPCWVI
jgi:hypothetical protein